MGALSFLKFCEEGGGVMGHPTPIKPKAWLSNFRGGRTVRDYINLLVLQNT